MILDTHVINWNKLNKAVSYYTDGDYEYIEVPWFVSKDALSVTWNRPTLSHKKLGNFVGSAEQSFIDLEINKKIKKGKFVTLTPCVRIEPALSDILQYNFMKVELYINENVNEETMHSAMTTCYCFMKTILPDDKQKHLRIIKTNEGFDINLGDIEVGSYGIRYHNKLSWVYATGLAEPRFSIALDKINKST